MNQKALLFIAHGSRIPSSNERIVDLADKISNKKNPYSKIKAAFLELASPSIEEAVDKLVKKYSHIDLFPYFLAPGIHYRKDIPEIIEQKKKQYFNCQFRLLDYFGNLPSIEKIILKYLQNQ